MSNSAGLVEQVSAALGKADIPHECYATLATSDGRPVTVGVVIPSEKNALGAIICGFIEDFKQLFLEEYNGEYDTVIPGLTPLTVYAATMLSSRALSLKSNRDHPILCVAVVDSLQEKLNEPPLREYLCEIFDEAFLKKDLDRMALFIKKGLSDPSFRVIEERVWEDERGLKRVTKRKVPINAMLWNSNLNNKKREEGD